MNRIRGGAIFLGLTVGAAFAATVGASRVAQAQETTGRVIGRVVDQDTGQPLAGVTVIVQGPQGEDATLTDAKGDYYFSSLTVGTYVIRFYVANAATQAERPGVLVSAEKTVRVNAKIAGTAQAAAQQTYVITGRPPSVDIGSARIGATFDETFNLNVPNGRTYGDVIQKAPGAFVDQSGNVSIGGSTGLENIYIVNGLNVTGMDLGNLENGAASVGGGTNLPLEFLTQIDVNSGGYQAEFGGGMGGVINTVLKGGSNEWHGSVFGFWSPYWLSGSPKVVVPVGSALAGVRKPDFDSQLGAEASGPLIKDKLFFWVGFAPRFTDTHVFRLTYAQSEAVDPMTGMPNGSPVLGADGLPAVQELRNWRARIDESRQSYAYATTVDFVVRPEHRLTFNLFGTPSYSEQLRETFGAGRDVMSDPSWAKQALTKTNTDATLRWVSKLFNRHMIIEANAGVHREDYNERSPNAALNGLNQLEYNGSDLWALEQAPGCEPTSSGFRPCPVLPNYHTGGYGQVKEYTGMRWLTELKLTNIFEGGGHHEVKYGWRMESSTFDQDRYYSGPLGARGLVFHDPNGTNFPEPNLGTYTFFTLQPGELPSDYGGPGSGAQHPLTDLFYTPQYQDHLKASVSSLSNAFFLQDTYSPEGLRNLTINLGLRYEMQRMNDLHGNTFLDLDNLGPRLGAVYDPLNDGRSKISVSYGRYYESIPMNIAVRYFGGEGILTRNGLPLSTCANPNPYSWTGAGEWHNCQIPAKGDAMGDAALGGTTPFNNGANYAVQGDIKGQFHNEIVATLEREVMEDLTVRLDYRHRWLGNVIEDGTADPNGSFVFVLANPGNVPQSAIDAAKADVTRYEGMDQTDPHVVSRLTDAQIKLANLQGMKAAPKPERTYDALSLSINKRFSRGLFARASYTYSRLFGNYEGLFQQEGSYFAPNGTNAYDTPDLYLNQKGPLPNDRPHLARIDGFYTLNLGKGALTFGLSFSGRSGAPRNYLSAWYFNSYHNQLLPRGSAGRTPPVTQFDGKVSYGRQLSPTVRAEAFVDLFNIFNQQATLQTDDVYTFQLAAAIVNGNKGDLDYAKDFSGQPVQKNPNFGHAVAYQAPFNGRLGLRLTF